MTSLRPPNNEPHRGVCTTGAARVNHVVRGLRVRGIDSREPWGKPGDTLRVRSLRRIENGLGHLLSHAFDKGLGLAKEVFRRAAIEHEHFHVNFGISLEHTASVSYLRSGRLRGLHAIVEQTPSGGWQTCADCRAVACGQVAFNPKHVVEDLVRLRKQFHDGGKLAVWVLTLRPISER